jgi:hypothetical protein
MTRSGRGRSLPLGLASTDAPGSEHTKQGDMRAGRPHDCDELTDARFGVRLRPIDKRRENSLTFGDYCQLTGPGTCGRPSESPAGGYEDCPWSG